MPADDRLSGHETAMALLFSTVTLPDLRPGPVSNQHARRPARTGSRPATASLSIPAGHQAAFTLAERLLAGWQAKWPHHQPRDAVKHVPQESTVLEAALTKALQLDSAQVLKVSPRQP